MEIYLYSNLFSQIIYHLFLAKLSRKYHFEKEKKSLFTEYIGEENFYFWPKVLTWVLF